MPTYGYSCQSCGYEFEQFQSMSEKSLRKCPSCGQRTLKRLIGVGAGVIFKGSGFYATDYRSESYKTAEKKEKSSATEKKSAGESGEVKSSEKSESGPKKKSA